MAFGSRAVGIATASMVVALTTLTAQQETGGRGGNAQSTTSAQRACSMAGATPANGVVEVRAENSPSISAPAP